MNFIINKESTKPYLRMELIETGLSNHSKFYDDIQKGCEVVFTMTDINNGVKRISNSPAYFVPRLDCDEEKYDIVYKWNKRDTQKEGTYKGEFKLTFNDGSILIAPIQEELIININQGSIRK